MTPEEEAAERMYPETTTTFGYGAVQEAFIAGYRSRDEEVAELEERISNLSWTINPDPGY